MHKLADRMQEVLRAEIFSDHKSRLAHAKGHHSEENFYICTLCIYLCIIMCLTNVWGLLPRLFFFLRGAHIDISTCISVADTPGRLGIDFSSQQPVPLFAMPTRSGPVVSCWIISPHFAGVVQLEMIQIVQFSSIVINFHQFSSIYSIFHFFICFFVSLILHTLQKITSMSVVHVNSPNLSATLFEACGKIGERVWC